MIDLKMFHYSSTVPAGILASQLFSKACRSFLTADLGHVGCKLLDWHFVFPRSPFYL